MMAAEPEKTVENPSEGPGPQSESYHKAMEAQESNLKGMVPDWMLAMDKGGTFGLGTQMMGTASGTPVTNDMIFGPGEAYSAQALWGRPQAPQEQEFTPLEAQKAGREVLREQREGAEKAHPLRYGLEELLGGLFNPANKIVAGGEFEKIIHKMLASGVTNAAVQGVGGAMSSGEDLLQRVEGGLGSGAIGFGTGLAGPVLGEGAAHAVEKAMGPTGHAVLGLVNKIANRLGEYGGQGVRTLEGDVQRDTHELVQGAEKELGQATTDVEKALGGVPEHVHRSMVRRGREELHKATLAASQASADALRHRGPGAVAAMQEAVPKFAERLEDKVLEKSMEKVREQYTDAMRGEGKPLDEGTVRKLALHEANPVHKAIEAARQETRKLRAKRKYHTTWVPDRSPMGGHIETRQGGAPERAYPNHED